MANLIDRNAVVKKSSTPASAQNRRFAAETVSKATRKKNEIKPPLLLTPSESKLQARPPNARYADAFKLLHQSVFLGLSALPNFCVDSSF